MSRLFSSENYLGGKKSDYFEGWYFRHNTTNCFSFIVGVSKFKEDPHSFIQYIDCHRSHYFRFPLSDFSFDKKNMCIKVGKNTFSMLGIKADIRLDGVMIKADIAYSNAVKYKKSIFAPSVMGPFSYLQLSCNHCVVSMDLKAHGSLSINGKAQVFYCGGYIEKDYGKSFPKNYLWLHAAGQGVNIMFSYAWPLLFGIRGFLCIVQHEGRQYNFSLYSGAKIRSLKISGDSSQVMLTKGNNRLIFEADSGHGGQKLIAPGKQGRMTNQIRENLQAGFWCKLTLGGREIDVSGINKCAYECVLESNKISESVSLAPGKVMPAGRFAASNSFEAAEDAGDTSD